MLVFTYTPVIVCTLTLTDGNSQTKGPLKILRERIIAIELRELDIVDNGGSLGTHYRNSFIKRSSYHLVSWKEVARDLGLT